MANDEQDNGKEVGMLGLPKPWSVAVQVVGTFGLAVFLVLYYVLVIHPRQAQRYEELRDSLDALNQIITSEQALIPKEHAADLEEPYVEAMAGQVAQLILGEVDAQTTKEDLAKKIEDRLILGTRLLEGLRREDERALSEMLTHKIRNSGVSEGIAKELEGLRSAEWRQITAFTKDVLIHAIHRQEMAK